MLRAWLPILLSLAAWAAASAATGQPNILFIAVDDLRPQLACYGKSKMHTPNIDRLAASGVLFERAYCMVPTCGASRASLFTSVRPARNRFVNYLAWAERDAPDAVTWNTHFRENGYRTLSLGKLFHHPEDNSEGWSERPWRPRNIPTYRREENQKLHQRRRAGGRGRGPAWEAADVADDAYRDGVLAARAVDTLETLSRDDTPFLLAVGFFKPHLPFVAPQKYWDLYDEADVQLPSNYAVPENAPDESIHSFGELRAYAGIPSSGPVSDETALKLIHGYYACVSYTDAQIGKLLDALDRLELDDNTIVVLWGDHGWNLGEHTLWCKHCCYETSMQIPLVVRAPGIGGGERTAGLTESIDIYPTLCELAGTETPQHVQGRSFVPLLREPSREWKPAAVGRYRNGDTVRTDAYRYTEYSRRDGDVVARMLYDHEQDPKETRNVAGQETLQPVVQRLSDTLSERMGRADSQRSTEN